MTDPGASLRHFAGGDEVDFREYRRWRQWAINKMNVMDKLPSKARGSFVWTLLQGKALEIVEHLKEEEYQCERGDEVIFKLLDQRWPQKDRSDEMGEHISEIFGLKAKEGESVRQWCGRARECFDRCNRKTGVNFPDEARGWILLQCSGMSEEQRAVVLARTMGELKFEAMALSMRSCFPEFTVPKRRSAGAHLVETKPLTEAMGPVNDDDPNTGATDFQDIELFLAEHVEDEAATADECYEEKDVADILAVSWKEKRQELARLKQSRQFNKEADTRRSFRIEVEELKKRTRCHKWKKMGHWARECRARGNPDSTERLQFNCPWSKLCAKCSRGALHLCCWMAKAINLAGATACQADVEAPSACQPCDVGVITGICCFGFWVWKDNRRCQYSEVVSCVVDKSWSSTASASARGEPFQVW